MKKSLIFHKPGEISRLCCIICIVSLNHSIKGEMFAAVIILALMAVVVLVANNESNGFAPAEVVAPEFIRNADNCGN